MAAGIRKISISQLAPETNNILVIGVIIAKQSPRVFPSKLGRDDRSVWNFTLRDSPNDTINGSFWGSVEGMKLCSNMFSVGDVVEIRNPRVMFKQPGSLDNFSPGVTCPFQIQLQEESSEIVPYAEEDADRIRVLRHIPTKPPGDFLRLSDIFCYGQAMKGQRVNLLVAVRRVGETRSVKSKKDGKDLVCRDVAVMDQSQLEFPITLWNEDMIRQADAWKPRFTILFLADMRLDWSTFRKSITTTANSCTVITENPRTEEAVALRNYARTVPIQPQAMLDHLASTIVDPSTITAVMSTEQVLDRAFAYSSEKQFTALLFATVTHFDIDGPQSAISYKCSRCSQFVDQSGADCLNLECPIGSGAEVAPPDVIFNLRVNLTDHRGTLTGCRLVSPAADKILNCSVQQFGNMSAEQKTVLKWKFLLTRCEARVLVLAATHDRPHPLISLLLCVPATPHQVASKLPIY